MGPRAWNTDWGHEWGQVSATYLYGEADGVFLDTPKSIYDFFKYYFLLAAMEVVIHFVRNFRSAINFDGNNSVFLSVLFSPHRKTEAL